MPACVPYRGTRGTTIRTVYWDGGPAPARRPAGRVITCHWLPGLRGLRLAATTSRRCTRAACCCAWGRATASGTAGETASRGARAVCQSPGTSSASSRPVDGRCRAVGSLRGTGCHPAERLRDWTSRRGGCAGGIGRPSSTDGRMQACGGAAAGRSPLDGMVPPESGSLAESDRLSPRCRQRRRSIPRCSSRRAGQAGSAAMRTASVRGSCCGTCSSLAGATERVARAKRRDQRSRVSRRRGRG